MRGYEYYCSISEVAGFANSALYSNAIFKNVGYGRGAGGQEGNAEGDRGVRQLRPLKYFRLGIEAFVGGQVFVNYAL